MATESIFHNIVIDDTKKAEAFVTALEQSGKASIKHPSRHGKRADNRSYAPKAMQTT